MTGLLIVGLAVAGVIALSWWLRRHEDGFPSKTSEGEETHTEPGVHFRRLESPPSEPFD
ncbi:MAG: hypothetical protein OEM22_07380 [Acidimicrobiia bacterium]|nr:hypothetical protein [Acidimicrobiia bacterium]MDH3471336.1 hypothetical protein [Acidimicrobiia bacterium]